MPIENKTWVTGEVITAEDLNKITPFLINASSSEGASVLDKTWQEIYDAINTGRIAYILNSFVDGSDYGNGVALVVNVYKGEDVYYVSSTNNEDFVCSSTDDFPAQGSIK